MAMPSVLGRVFSGSYAKCSGIVVLRFRGLTGDLVLALKVKRTKHL